MRRAMRGIERFPGCDSTWANKTSVDSNRKGDEASPMNRSIILTGCMLILAAIACNAPQPIGPVTGIPDTAPATAVPSSAATTDSTLQVAAAATDSSAENSSSGNSLPLPLYLLGVDNQIWRVEPDGETTSQITFEPLPVTEFSVSADGLQIAYVTNNSLYTVDSAGAGRALIVQGPPPAAEDDYAGRINSSLGSIYWAPSGQQITYGLGGINIYDIINGTSTSLIQSDPYPDPNDPNPPAGPIRFFSAGAFSPDGKRVLAPFGYFPEAGGEGVIDLESGSLTEITNPDGIVCCSLSWSQDSASLYFANPLPGMIPAGLWRADAASGQTVTLVNGGTEGNFQMFDFPQQGTDGDLYYFYGTSATYPESNPVLTMTKSAADGITNRISLRTDSHRVASVLWATDASGAVILNFDSMEQGTFLLRGELTWLPSDGSAPFVLPLPGSQPHWGR